MAALNWVRVSSVQCIPDLCSFPRINSALGTCCPSGTRRFDSHSSRWKQRGLVGQRKASVLALAGQADTIAAQFEDSRSSSSSSVQQLLEGPRTAADVVREFYDLINQRNVPAVANLFTEDCVYEDFNFSEPTKGREATVKFFEKVMSSFGKELKFVIDDITTDDPNAVGVIWHLDWRGKSFPFSKGCSFYRCEVNSSGKRQIKYSRDIVEPASRPGDIAMAGLKLVTSLFERFPQLADRL